MIWMVLLGIGSGMLVSLSRQLNGRLALSTSAMQSSFWNHLVGFVVLVPCALLAGSLWPAEAVSAHWFAWAGGAIGVVFVASGSWLIPRLGAALTGGLLVAGQMLSSVAFDLLRGVDAILWMQISGVALILLGVYLSRRG